MFRAQCSAGFGKNGKACSRCASSSCGVCAKDYKKCELKKTTCLKPDWTNWEPTGTKVAWNTDGYCNNAPGLSGTGYSSTFTPTIANYYQTDPISRASPTMDECTATYITPPRAEAAE